MKGLGKEVENKRTRKEEMKRYGEKEENETVKKRCVSSNLAEAFDIYQSRGRVGKL